MKDVYAIVIPSSGIGEYDFNGPVDDHGVKQINELRCQGDTVFIDKDGRVVRDGPMAQGDGRVMIALSMPLDRNFDVVDGWRSAVERWVANESDPSAGSQAGGEQGWMRQYGWRLKDVTVVQ